MDGCRPRLSHEPIESGDDVGVIALDRKGVAKNPLSPFRETLDTERSSAVGLQCCSAPQQSVPDAWRVSLSR
jgi:hypothetical protein